MSAKNYNDALAQVLKHEGGFSHHKDDPGGATMRGVTQRVYDAYRINKGNYKQSVRYITDTEIRDIYKRQYWDAVRGDDLPNGVDYAVFDYAVNSGPSRAIKDLQHVIGEQQDGIIGQRTLAAITRADSLHGFIDKYCDRRLSFMQSLKNWPTFKNGWTSRVAAVRAYAKKLANGYTAKQVAADISSKDLENITQAERADPAKVAVTKTTEGRAGAMAGLGVMGSAITDATAQIAPIQDAVPALQWLFIALTVAGVGLGLYATFRRLRAGGA